MDGKFYETSNIKEYLSGLDPFDIPLDTYRSLVTDDKHRNLANRIITERLYKLHGNWIYEEFDKRRMAQSLVLCDGEVILESKERYGPENFIQVEARIGKPCYLVAREALIEESRWSDLKGGDYYPTLEVYIGNTDWSDDDVFENGGKVASDFDTGNPVYVVLDENLCRRIVEAPERILRSSHLGQVYFSYLRNMKVGLKDNKQGRCMEKIVEGVGDWDDVEWNPYKLANPDREGFVSRDIMLELLARITLDPQKKESTWELL